MRVDVAVERGLVGDHLLEQRRLAGIAERAARPAVALEHRHRVGAGDEGRVGEPGRPRPDDGDALALRRLRRGEAGLVAGRGVDDAAQLRAAAHLVDAGVAGKAAPRRLAAGELGDPFGLGDQGAPERHEIRLAGCDRIRRDRRIAEPADRDDRHRDVLLDVRRIGQERRVGILHRRDHARRRRQRAVMAGRDVQRVGARLRGPDRDLPALRERQAVGEIVVDREPEDHRDAHRGLDGAPAPRGRSARGFRASPHRRRCAGSRTG